MNHYSHISLNEILNLLSKCFIINKMHRIYSSVINKLSLTDVCTIKGLCCRNFRMQFTTLSCPVSLASSIRQSNAMYVPVLPIPALSERKAWIFNRFQSINIIFYRRIQEIIYVSLRWFLNQHRTCCICFSYDNFLYEGRYYYVVFFISTCNAL